MLEFLRSSLNHKRSLSTWLLGASLGDIEADDPNSGY